MNPERVSNADIDTDYAGQERDRVKEFLLRDRMNLPNIKTSEIITFNTIALKGAIRDVSRALKIPLPEVSEICSRCVPGPKGDVAPDDLRDEYPELFRYVDIVNGTIVSVGTHPSGVLVSDLDIEACVGLCSTSSSPYPVSMLNMKELDDLFFVKLDILGLDNLGTINETCKMLGIERLTPDNTDLDDMDVWRSIRDDTTLIFQWESSYSGTLLKKFMSDQTLERVRRQVPDFSMIKWMSFGNGLIRPACASFRDSVTSGEFYDNGLKELNDLLAKEAGHIAMQETIMKFLVQFCGYSNGESDTVRRGIAKKKGTEQLLPEIEQRFISYTSEHYGVPKEKCQEIIKPFLQVILDASSYAFSWNHSDSYSCIGYICGYLRHYYPMEFLTASLNIFGDNQTKTAEIIKYAAKRKIRVVAPKFGISKENYFYDKETNTIAKGLSSVKYMSKAVSDELYNLSQKSSFNSFTDLLYAIDNETSLDSRQLELLIKIDFFSAFGNQRELLRIRDMFYLFKKGQIKQMKRDQVDGTELAEIIRRHATWKTKSGDEAKSYTLTDPMAILREIEAAIKAVGMDDLSLPLKVQNFNEIMGYAGYISGDEKDRRKLYVRDVFPLKRKADGKLFGYNVLTQSIGSGKESAMTVFKTRFEREPIKKGDIILCKTWSREGKYFRMTDYEHVVA